MGGDWSYGVSVLPAYITALKGKNIVQNESPYFYAFVSHTTSILARFPFLPYIIAIFILLLYVGWGIKNRSPAHYDDLRNLKAFWLGAGIYIGTFLLGNNWDYRLIFLLFTLPQLTFWVRSRDSKFVLPAATTLFVLIMSLWYTLIREVTAAISPVMYWVYPILDGGAKWAVFAGLIYLYTASLPPWIADNIRALPMKLLLWIRPRVTELDK